MLLFVINIVVLVYFTFGLLDCIYLYVYFDFMFFSYLYFNLQKVTVKLTMNLYDNEFVQ